MPEIDEYKMLNYLVQSQYGKGDQTITVHTDYSSEWKKNIT